MGMITPLETDSGTNVDIHAATAVGAYTSTGDKLVMVDVSIDQVAGNGDYVMYVTRQIGGSGSAYRILPQTTMSAASGLTAISGQSGWITVRNGDVLTCYVVGLAGDTSTPDYTTRWFEAAVQLVTLADDAITAAKFDESTAFPLKSADTGATQVARVGADSDTLETLSDQLDATALEATLTAIKGTGWVSTESLTAIYANIDTLYDGILLILGTGWTDESLVNLMAAIEAISAGSGATAQEVWEYVTRTLTNPDDYKADVSGLATTTHLQDVEDKVDIVDGVADAIKLKTDNIPADPAVAGEYTSTLDAIQADLDNTDQYKADVSGLATTAHVQEVEDKVDAVRAGVDSVGAGMATPASVWAHPERTLTVSSIRPRTLIEGDQFTIYKDTTINIPITKLGDISAYDNLWFTIKREQDLEAADDQSVVHMDFLTGMLYLNKAAVAAELGSITMVDATTGSINVLVVTEGAALLPVYAREPLRWEVKGIHGDIVDILLQGSCFIQPAVSRKIS